MQIQGGKLNRVLSRSGILMLPLNSAHQTTAVSEYRRFRKEAEVVCVS
jgi:hypothetical protein